MYQRPQFMEIAALVEDDAPRLETFPVINRYEYAGWLEEVAIMVDGGLLPNRLAHYMFGHYVLSWWESENFWKGVGDKEESPYWKHLKKFVSLMQIEKESLRSAKPVRPFDL